MDTEKCRILLETISRGSMTKAADSLGYTPSGVVRAIKSLEQETGFPLLTRNSKGVALTKEGEKLLPVLREMMHWEKQYRDLSDSIRGLETGELSVGSYFSVAYHFMPAIISSFQEKYPGISIHLVEEGNKELRRKLLAHELDCAIISRQTYEGPWIPLFKDELLVWLPENPPLAKAESFPIRQLEKENFINELPGKGTDSEWLFEKEKLKLHVKFSTTDDYTCYKMVEAGLGISLNNALTSAFWPGRVAKVPLDPPQYLELGIAVPDRMSPALSRFIDYVVKVMRK